MGSPGGFLSGMLGVVGPRLEEKHQDYLARKSRQQQADFQIQMAAKSNAVKRLMELHQKELSGTPLSDQENKEAEQIAAQYQQSSTALDKMARGDKPLFQGLRKVDGFVQQILHHSRNRGGQGQGQPQQGQGQGQGQAAPGATPQGATQPQGAPDESGQPSAPPPTGAQPGAPQASPRNTLSAPDWRQQLTQPGQMSAEALANPHVQAAAEERQIYDLWVGRGKALGLQGRDLAEYAGSKGARLPAEARPSTAAEKKEQLHQAYVDLGYNEEEATKKTAEALTQPKGHNLQAGWVKRPGQQLLVKVWEDPQAPGKRFFADTGQPVSQDIPSVDPTQIAAEERAYYYGPFNTYYRAALGKGYPEEQAKQVAGDMIFREYGVRLSAQEQGIALKQFLSGVGGGGGFTPPAPKPAAAGGAAPAPAAAAPPASAAGTPAPAAAAATPAAAPKPTPRNKLSAPAPGAGGRTITIDPSKRPSADGGPPALNGEDLRHVNMYLASLFGASPGNAGGTAAMVGRQKGMDLLAKASGLTPVEFQTQQALNKDRIKALGDTYVRYNAVTRIGELLKGFGENVEQLGQKAIATNDPILNRAWKSISLNTVGNPDLRQYLLALNALDRQYSVLTAGGALSRAMLPVSVGERVEQLISPNMNLKEAIAVVDQLKTETEIERDGFRRSIQDTVNDIRGSVASGKGGGAATGGGKTPEQEAADYLKSLEK